MQHLIEGENSFQLVAAEIKAKGYHTVFLITGSHFIKENDIGFLQNLTIHNYVKKGSNVEEQEVEAAAALFQQSKAGVILAAGGGSVMDLAKAIIFHSVQLSQPVPFFIAAPTTAGSGSEATAFAVVYRGKKKYSLVHPSLLPQTVVLDPLLTCSLPAYQTAVTGMDAFSQAVESYWNRNATAESKDCASKAILLWKDSFLIAVKDGTDKTARSKMLQAAHFAGKAIAITRTTGPHALSYFLTANYNVAHGQAVALFLPAFFIYNSPLDELCSLLGVSAAAAAATWVREIMKEAGLATSLAELRIEKEKVLDALLDEVNEERFANNPAPFERQKLRQLLADNI